MPNSFGITLLVVYGVLQHWELFIRFFIGRWKIFSTVIYIAMGLIMLVVDVLSLKVFQYILNDSNWTLYLVGVVLLVEKYRYNHAVWHFVLVAAVCHYVAILLAVVSD
jgi:hemolysin III